MRRRLLETLLPGTRARRFGRLLLYAGIVGMIAGLGAILFQLLLGAANWFFLDWLAGYRPGEAAGETSFFAPTDTPFRRWMFFFVPALGGLISGVLVFRFAPEAEGHGTDAVIDAFHRRGGEIRARVPLIKTIASAVTIGSGGAGGREGPIAQIGAGFGSVFARLVRLSPRDRCLLVAAGMGAGIGAIFHAPLAGALFAAEVLYREIDFEFEVIVPATVASIIGYAVSAAAFGWQPLFRTPQMMFRNPAELIGYLVLAVVLALSAGLFVRVFYGTRDLFRALRLPDWSKPMIGGLGTGAIGYFFPDALSTGYGIVQRALDGQVVVGFLVAAVLLRMLTTSLSIGSGGSGGVFGPSVVIGGSLGGCVGLALHEFAPWLAPHPEAYVMVGMAAFFAAAANTPLSSVIIVSEMTGNYNLLVPTLWTSAFAFVLASRTSLYENQVDSRADAPLHSGTMALEVLRRLRARDAMLPLDQARARLVEPSTPFDQLVRLFAETGGASFPVLRDGRLVGVVTDAQIRAALADRDSIGRLLVAQDMMVAAITISENETLDAAVRRMIRHQLGELVVVAESDPERVVGLLSRAQIVAAYDREILRAENML
ncbi:MAG: chloride channel protein [Acidobacteriota bacterium]